MRWKEQQPERPPPAVIRGTLLGSVEKMAANPAEAEQLLLQCAGYYHNQRMIQRFAKELDLELVQGNANAELQVYYDIQRNGGDWGYISRGWDEPGFRVGQVLDVPNNKLPDFLRYSESIIRDLAARGIVITIESKHEAALTHLHLTLNLPDAGLDPNVLLELLTNLFEVTRQIKKTIPCD
jgi:hypothetical protein